MTAQSSPSSSAQSSPSNSAESSGSNSAQVLIVGAGPTGLTAAATLAKLGVRVRIVDKNHGPSEQSRALGVQAGTLTCLEAVFQSEIVKKMIENGRAVREAFLHFDELSPIPVDLSTIPSPYNFILILAQSETEKFLEAEARKYGVTVERNTELTACEAKPEHISSTLKLPDGRTETLETEFVIGCDGAHSLVRRAVQIDFAGNQYTGDFILADVKIKWPWPTDSIRTFVNSKGVIASFPMRGENNYRLILIPKNALPPPVSQEIGAEEFKTILASLSNRRIEISDATWMTRFRVHHRIASHFQKGRVFLAGDAAHIHSPAGGQGMNTGIQDALHLGIKIANVLKKTASLATLADYEKERMPVARSVLRTTDAVFKMALLPENRFVSFARRHLIPHLISNAFLQRHVVLGISEMRVAGKEKTRT